MRIRSLVAAAVLCVSGPVAHAAEKASAASYRVVPVEKTTGALSVTVAGTVTPFKTVQLTAQMPGRVKHIWGREGDRFEQGAVLVELDDSGLLARREAALAARESALVAIQNAQAQYQRELYSPRSDAVRSAPGGFGFPGMMDQMFGVPMQDALGMRDHDAERYTDVVDVQSRLAQAQNSLRQTDANIREIDASLRDTRSVAPFAGVIDKVYVEEGDTVQPGQPLVDFSQEGLYKVEADLPVHLARHLAPGQSLPVRLGNQATPIEAQVYRIHPTADLKRHTIHVELTLPPGVPVTAGQYAEITVADRGAQVTPQLSIPSTAIIHKSGMPLVFSVDPQGIAHLRVVRLGEAMGHGRISVLSGLREGDRIIDSPPPGLKAGQQVLDPSDSRPQAQALPQQEG